MLADLVFTQVIAFSLSVHDVAVGSMTRRAPFLVELASPWNGDGLDIDGFQWTGLGEDNGNLRVQSLATPSDVRAHLGAAARKAGGLGRDGSRGSSFPAPRTPLERPVTRVSDAIPERGVPEHIDSRPQSACGLNADSRGTCALEGASRNGS